MGNGKTLWMGEMEAWMDENLSAPPPTESPLHREDEDERRCASCLRAIYLSSLVCAGHCLRHKWLAGPTGSHYSHASK